MIVPCFLLQTVAGICTVSFIANSIVIVAVGSFRNNFVSSYCLTYDMEDATTLTFLTILIYFRTVINFVMPFHAILVISVKILRSLNGARNERNMFNIPSNNAAELQSIIIVLLAAFSFLFFSLPEGITPLLTLYEIPIETASILEPCATMLTLFRSGANLIIYFMVSSQFRSGLFTTCRIVYLRMRDLLSKSNSTTSTSP